MLFYTAIHKIYYTAGAAGNVAGIWCQRVFGWQRCIQKPCPKYSANRALRLVVPSSGIARWILVTRSRIFSVWLKALFAKLASYEWKSRRYNISFPSHRHSYLWEELTFTINNSRGRQKPYQDRFLELLTLPPNHLRTSSTQRVDIAFQRRANKHCSNMPLCTSSA